MNKTITKGMTYGETHKLVYTMRMKEGSQEGFINKFNGLEFDLFQRREIVKFKISLDKESDFEDIVKQDGYEILNLR